MLSTRGLRRTRRDEENFLDRTSMKEIIIIQSIYAAIELSSSSFIFSSIEDYALEDHYTLIPQ